MATTLDRVLAAARSQIGTRERSDGSSKYGAWYSQVKNAPGFDKAAWCQIFTGWCANEAGLPESAFPRMAYTPYAVQWFKDRGRWGSKPRKCALVYYNFPGGDFVDHVEIVEAVRSDGSIVTIGGNVGNQVQRLVRRSNIAGYGYPDYGAEPLARPNPVMVKTWMEEVMDALPLLKPGAKGTAVKRMFYLIVSHGFALDPKVLDDTVMSEPVVKQLKALQKAEKLTADGECGPKTWTALIKP
jgi:hypothetical protein